MISILNKIDCCGCTACANICPAKCINMIEDFEGFLYPSIDLERCMDCHLCEKVCPIKNSFEETSYERRAYVVRTKNPHTLYKSTSGGLFTPLASMILQDNGVLCAASYDTNFSVKHVIIDYNTCAGGY